MKFPRVTTFSMATLPISLVSSALGLGTFEYPVGRPRRILSCCWVAACLILFCYSIWALNDNMEHVGESSIRVISFRLYDHNTILSVIVLVCIAQLQSKNIATCLHELDTVNKIFNQIGISKEYESLFKLQIIELTTILICLLLLSVVRYLYMSSHEPNVVKQIGQTLIDLYMTIINILVSYTFCIYVRYIRKRFQHLNSYFIKLTAGEENAETLFKNSLMDRHIRWLSPGELGMIIVHPQFVGNAMERRLMSVVQNTKKIHRDLCNIARKLNEAFGVSIVISLANTFYFFVVFCYMFFVSENIADSVILFTWITIFSTKVVYIASVCSKTSDEAQRMTQLLHRLIGQTTDTVMREEVHTLWMELNFNPLRFKAWRFLELNYMLITKMIGAVITYLIILFRLENDFGNANTSQNVTLSVMNTTA